MMVLLAEAKLISTAIILFSVVAVEVKTVVLKQEQ
jgi:hypothetical protein